MLTLSCEPRAPSAAPARQHRAAERAPGAHVGEHVPGGDAARRRAHLGLDPVAWRRPRPRRGSAAPPARPTRVGRALGQRAHPTDGHVPAAGSVADQVIEEATVLPQQRVVRGRERADRAIGERDAAYQVGRRPLEGSDSGASNSASHACLVDQLAHPLGSAAAGSASETRARRRPQRAPSGGGPAARTPCAARPRRRRSSLSRPAGNRLTRYAKRDRRTPTPSNGEPEIAAPPTSAPRSSTTSTSAGAGEQRRGDEPVMSAADDDGIVAAGHQQNRESTDTLIFRWGRLVCPAGASRRP